MNPLLVRCHLLFATLLTFTLVGSVSAEPLRYQLQSGQTFSYRFDITVDAPDAVTSYKGITNYTVQSASGDQVRLMYQGGLNETSQPKDIGPRGGFSRFPEPPMMPFGRSMFAGKTMTTNTITMSTRGNVLAMEGDSQLPYLIGNVSLLPFEPLPEDEQQQWTAGGGLAISHSDERQNRFAPFSPFNDGGPDRSKVMAANEESTYVIQQQDDKQIVIKKTSRMSTPAGAGNSTFDSEEVGTWTFDPVAHVPVTMDVQTTLNLKVSNISVTLPIKIKFERLSEEELTKVEEERKARVDAMAKASAERKALAAKPLTAEEKQALLTALASTEEHTVVKALMDLANKQPKETDPELVRAIEPLLAHTSTGVSMTAKRAMARWSPDYEKNQSLAESYRRPSSVPSTNLPVNASTKLFVGQILQTTDPQRFGNDSQMWYPAVIEELLPNGTVRVARLAGDRHIRSAVVPRNQLQLAPPELAQPSKPAKADSLPAEMRTWTDASGRFKLEAVYVSLFEGKVNLRGKDGRVIAVPLEKLCKEDQVIVQKAQDDSENPFAQ